MNVIKITGEKKKETIFSQQSLEMPGNLIVSLKLSDDTFITLHWGIALGMQFFKSQLVMKTC